MFLFIDNSTECLKIKNKIIMIRRSLLMVSLPYNSVRVIFNWRLTNVLTKPDIELNTVKLVIMNSVLTLITCWL